MKICSVKIHTLILKVFFWYKKLVQLKTSNVAYGNNEAAFQILEFNGPFIIIKCRSCGEILSFVNGPEVESEQDTIYLWLIIM